MKSNSDNATTGEQHTGSRGVTQEQAKRVKKLYEQQNGSADKDANATMQNRNRLREKTKTQEDIYVTENFTFDQRPAAGGV